MGPSETDRWGRLQADDIVRKLIDVAISKRLPFPESFLVSGLVGWALFGSGDHEAARAMAELRAELGEISRKMDQTLAAVHAIAEQIQWTRLVLEAQPAADRILETFGKLRTLDVGHPRLAKQLIHDVLDFNEGTLVDLATLHQVIVGLDPVDPGQISLVEAWTHQVSDNPNLVEGVAWVNAYFTYLAQIQLQGLILLVNALRAEQQTDLAHDMVKVQADRMRQQVDLLRSFDVSFTRKMPLPRQSSFVQTGGPFCDDGARILFGTPLFLHHADADDDVAGLSNDTGLNGGIVYLNAPPMSPAFSSVAWFNGTFYAAGIRNGALGAEEVIVRGLDRGSQKWTDSLRAPAAAALKGRTLLFAHGDRLYTAFGHTMATTTNGIDWRSSSHSEADLPLLLFASGDTTYLAYTSLSNRAVIFFVPFAVAQSGDIELGSSVHSTALGTDSDFADSGYHFAVFKDRFVMVSVDPPDDVGTASIPLSRIVEGAPGFSVDNVRVPNPDAARSMEFSGVLGAGQIFQVALFTGTNAPYAQESDYQLRLSAVARLFRDVAGAG